MLPTKKASLKQEKRVAKEVGGRATIASGALYSQKGDVRTDRFLIECKTTEKDFFTFTRKVWDKIRREAIKDGMRYPVLSVEFAAQLKQSAIFSFNDLGHFFLTQSRMLSLLHSGVGYEGMVIESLRIWYNRPWQFFTLDGALMMRVPWEEFLEMKEEIGNGQ
jgi:hypothetical protein